MVKLKAEVKVRLNDEGLMALLEELAELRARIEVLRYKSGQPNGVRPLGLTWGDNDREGGDHVEWHAECGCAYHPDGDQGPHIHQCNWHSVDNC